MTGTSKSPRESQRETGISRSIVRGIAKDDLKLKIIRRCEVQQLSDSASKKKLRPCMRIKQRMTVAKIERTLFNDEKIFTELTPINTQNDRVYARVLKNEMRNKLLKGVVNLLLLTEEPIYCVLIGFTS